MNQDGEFLSLDETAAIAGEIRPWDRDGYGTDGRATGIVDYYDGWHYGCSSDDGVMQVPRACHDPKQWILGWQNGYGKGDGAQWRREHAARSAK